MANLLKGVAQGARGLFASDDDEDEVDAGLEALLVRRRRVAADRPVPP